MKIAIVCYPTFGGSGVVATELGIALAERGHEIHFITYQQPVRLGFLNNNIHFHEVHVPKYPLFRYQPYELALSSKLVDTIKHYDIELLHVHYAIPHAYAGYMAKKMLLEDNIYIPMITTLHGTDITLVGNHPFYKSAVTFSINKSDVVTSVSEDLKQKTLEIFSVENDIEVIPNFIDSKKYDEAFTNCQRSLMASDAEKIITHVSNFRAVKRIPDVVSIFHKIQQRIPSKLIMVGEGPEKEKAEQQCKQLGIEKKVLFLGNSNEIDRILCFSDLFLLPSVTESFGLAALEAMANRTAIISSNTGGIPEVNKQGVSGFLSNVGNINEMAQNAIYILEDENRLAQFKNNAKKISKEFELNTILPLYERIYEKAYQSRFKNSY